VPCSVKKCCPSRLVVGHRQRTPAQRSQISSTTSHLPLVQTTRPAAQKDRKMLIPRLDVSRAKPFGVGWSYIISCIWPSDMRTPVSALVGACGRAGRLVRLKHCPGARCNSVDSSVTSLLLRIILHAWLLDGRVHCLLASCLPGSPPLLSDSR
jgi:hypothetical protein